MAPGAGSVARLVIVCGFMSAFYAFTATMVYVVTHHPVLAKDEYKVAVTYSLETGIFFMLLSVVYTGYRLGGLVHVWRLWRVLAQFRVTGIMGIAWAVNFCCIFVAGAYLPNPIQTMFSQASLAMVFYVDMFVFKHEIKWFQHMAVASICTFNIAVAVQQGFDSPTTGWQLFVWCIVFLVNALGAGLSYVLVEALFSVARIEGDSGLFRGGYDALDYIFAVNAVGQVWSSLFCLPLVGLAWMAYGNNAIDVVFGNWDMFRSGDAQIVLLLAGLGSWLNNCFAFFVIHLTDAMWMNIASQTAIILQVFIMSQPIAGAYQAVPTPAEWTINVCQSLLALLYVSGSRGGNPHNVLESRIGRSFAGALVKAFPGIGETERLYGTEDEADSLEGGQ